MRVGYLGAAAVGLGIMLAGASFAATIAEMPLEEGWRSVEDRPPLIFDVPETPDIIDVPAPDCAADGPGCPQFVPPPDGDGDFGVIPLPAPIFALAAGIVALFGLGRRRRSA